MQQLRLIVGELDAAYNIMPPAAAVFAIEFNVNFISLAKGERTLLEVV
jgi:hypothetical protein